MSQPDLKLKQDVLAKIELRDFSAVGELLNLKCELVGPEAAMRWMRMAILSELDRESCLWFWQQGMSSQFEETLKRVFTTCCQVLSTHPLIRKDSWWTTEDEDNRPLIWINKEAHRALLDALPVERHGALPMIVQHLPTPRRTDNGLQKIERTTIRRRLRHRDSVSFSEELARATGLEAQHFIRP